MKSKESPFKQKNYKVYGAVNKPCILVIHGFPGNANDWIETALQLCDEYYIIIPDLLGFGLNAQKDIAFNDLWLQSQAHNILNILKIENLKEINIIAHDYGVPVAITLIHQLKNINIKSLIITAGNTLSMAPLNPLMKTVPFPIIGNLAKTFLFSKLSINMMRTMGTHKGKIYPIKNSINERQALKTIFSTALMNLKNYFLPVEKIAETLQVKTLIIWGDKDPFFPVSHAQRMKNKMPNAKLIIYNKVGHYAFIEERDKFVKDVKWFIKNESRN